MIPRRIKWLLFLGIFAGVNSTQAVVLWSDLGTTLIHDTGTGFDVLGGAVKEDDSSTNTLYFKVHIDPLSDASTEEYFAAFELYESDKERLGIGNALKAWAYSAFRADASGQSHGGADYIDLHSSRPEPATPGTSIIYENPHRGIECTIVFKVQYVPGDDDLVTVWLNPDLGPGASEQAQPENLITRFKANASFNEIHLRHGGGGDGWIFSDMAIATSFNDFVAMNGNEARMENHELPKEEPLSTFQTWHSEQGLPQDRVRALAQTSDGYMWVGTDDGVARFDGVRFVSYGLPEGLPSGPVRTLFGDSHGSLWIGSVGEGLIRWQGGRFTAFTMADGLPSDSISALAEDAEGSLWIGTDAGLVLLQGGRLTSLKAADEFKGRAVTTLFRDRQGNMWLGVAEMGVFEFQAGKFIPLTGGVTGELLEDPHSLLVDTKGRIWIGAGDDFVLCRDKEQWRPYRLPRHFARSYVCALGEEPDGTVWAGSVSEGLLKFKDGEQLTINASSGLSDNSVESLLVDRDGNLWVGTEVGLNLLRQKNLFAFDQKQGLGYGAVGGLAEITPGTVWVGKPGDGLYRWNGRSFSRLMSANLSIVGQQINTLLSSRDGSCWVAGAYGLLHFGSPANTTDKAELFSLPGANIISLCEDPKGSLWVGTREGQVWRLENDQWKAQTNLTRAVTAIVSGTNGVIWIGTEGDGVYELNGATGARLDTTNGLLSDLIRTLYLDPQGTLWIGTAGGGLSWWRQGRMAALTTREGLPDNTISEILEDGKGRLWLGSNRGINCVGKEELEQLAMGKIPAVYPQVYGRAEGMLSEECSGGFCPAGLKSASGQLWFPTLKGVVVVDPQVDLSRMPAPEVLLEEVLVDGVPNSGFQVVGPTTGKGDAKPATAAASVSVLKLGPGKHRIEFQYTALGFDTPERIRFRYRLEALDSDWVEAGNRRVAFYSYIPPGNYRFHVIACNADGIWNETGATLVVAVSKYFWQTWWFLGLSVLTLLVAVVGVVRFTVRRRLQRRLRQLEQERVLERERTRIAQDLHDEMGAKLCRISFLSEDARRNHNVSSELQHQIVSISDASREVLHSLDEIVWAVNPQNDTVEHVASYLGHYAQEYFQETGIECKVDIPERLPPYTLSSQLRHHLLLAVHEAFTNALKHSHASQISVCMIYDGSALEIVISDNGNGFDPSVLHPAAGDSRVATGNGLRNMSQRLADIGGRCIIEPRVGRGVTVRFVLPLNQPVEKW